MAENTTALAGQIVAAKVSASREDLLKLDSSAWNSATAYDIETATTPLANQPSPYIKATREEKDLGKVKLIKVQAAHNGKEIFFRVRWTSEQPNYTIGDLNTFPDGIALLFPMKNVADTPIKEMGTPDAPTNAWYWRADFDNKPKNQISEGLSTSLYTDDSSVVANSEWKNGEWTVVIGRSFTVKENAVALAAGSPMSVGVSAWEGAAGERGGVKAFSKEWRDLVLA